MEVTNVIHGRSLHGVRRDSRSAQIATARIRRFTDSLGGGLHGAAVVGGRIRRRMPARLTWLVVLFLSLSAALPSAAAAVVRLGTSQETVTSPVPARRADPANASSYFGARYYRADVGRFTTVDPELDIKAALVDPQRWNHYAYVTSNPLKYTDPDGKNPLLIAGGIGAAVYGGWAIYQNVSHGKSWYNNVGFEAAKGFLVGATLGAAGPALASTEMQLGIAATGAGEVIAGPYGQVTRDALERAASSTGSTVEVVTRLTSAPQAGRALSAAGGQGAEALANASRSGGALFTAQIPSALVKALQSAGLVEVKTTLMNGAVSTEYRFLPNATQFIVKYFEKQKQ
jgi:RHS repeat-associated protein